MTNHRWYTAIWLVYVGFIFMEPYLSRAPLWEWLFAAATIAVFVPLYFGAFGAAGRVSLRAVSFIVATGILGLGVVPLNGGGSTYVLFSAAVAGFVFERRRDTVAYVLGAGAVLLLVMFLTRRPFETWMLF